MNSITQHILSLFSDTSFPPLVMIDGSWGEGKTYFAKDTLIPELTEQGYNCVFFSLTGLSSIDDFKDRLLSSSYFKSEINSEVRKSYSSIISSVISNFGGDNSGAIASVLNGASGILKESLLSRLSDKIIIIDDLDRVKDKGLPDLILGECLQLTDESDLKFVFIVNDQKNTADAALKEKVISGTVKLNKDLSESISIAFSSYHWFDQYKQEIEKVVKNHNLKNLRVLKRTSKKVDDIYGVLQSDDSLDLEQCMSSLINATILIMFYHYEIGLSEESIWYNSKYSSRLPDSASQEVYKYPDLVDIHWLLTKPLINFLVGGSNWSLSLEDFGRLQKKGCPIDAFILSSYINQDDETFEQNVDALQKFVFEDVHVPFSKWFEASHFYHSLQLDEFLVEDRPTISQNFEELVSQKCFDYSDLDGDRHRLRISESDDIVYSEYEKAKGSYRSKSLWEKQQDMFHRIKESWNNVDMEVFREYRSQPFFNQFSAEQLIECIANWKNSDILLFSDFVTKRYEQKNAKKRLSEESEIVSELLKGSQSMYESEALGRKKGALKLLTYALSSAKEKITIDGDQT